MVRELSRRLDDRKPADVRPEREHTETDMHADGIVQARVEELRADATYQEKVAKIRRDLANDSLVGKRMNRSDVEKLQEAILPPQ